MGNLAYMYLEGKGCDQDLTQAWHCFRQANAISVVYLLEYNSMPCAMLDLLEEDPVLAQCHAELRQRLLPTTLGNRSRIYIPPMYLEPVRAKAGRLNLQPQHVIAVESVKDRIQ